MRVKYIYIVQRPLLERYRSNSSGIITENKSDLDYSAILIP
jgi:hypothetical protein